MSPSKSIATSPLTLALVLSLAPAFTACSTAGSSKPPTASPTPIQLVAHATHFAARLHGGFQVSGRLYPSLPYQNRPNSIQLTVLRHGRTQRSGAVLVGLSMPGMHMAPDHSVTRFSGGHFAGRLRLPMFGIYRMLLVYRTLGHTQSGSVSLPVTFR